MQLTKLIWSFLMVFLVASCGGGGGGGSTTDGNQGGDSNPVVVDEPENPVTFTVSVTEIDIRDGDGNPISVDISGISNTLTLSE